MAAPRGRLRSRDRNRRQRPLPEAAATIPTTANTAAMVSTGVVPAGVLRLQLVPAQPEGNVGGPSATMVAALAGVKLPVSTV
jgi:hypothetical protein